MVNQETQTSHYLLKNCATLCLHTLGNDSSCDRLESKLKPFVKNTEV